MAEIRNSPESTNAFVAWDAFVAGVVDRAEQSQTPWLLAFPGGTVRLSPAGKPEKISFARSHGPDGSEDVAIFFDEIGQVSRVQRKLSDTRSFDNGVRRGPTRRSLVSEVSLVQDFDAEGRPTKPETPYRAGQMELHVHTMSFVGGSNHETANSLLEYDFEGNSIIPAGDRVGDMTSHFPGADRIKILETFLDGRGSENPVSRKDSQPDTEALVKTCEGKLNYEIVIDDARIAVFMGDAYVASFAYERLF